MRMSFAVFLMLALFVAPAAVPVAPAATAV